MSLANRLHSSMWRCCLLPICMAMASCATSAPTPTGKWSFEGPGEQVEDLTGNGLDGVAADCGRTPGKVGSALRLDGAGGLVVPDSPLLRGTNGFTVECWMNSDVPPGPARNIISKPNEFMLRVDPDAAGGTISFFVWTEGAGWEPRARGPRLQADRWYHLVASWDGKTARLLVNRTVVNSPKAGACPRRDTPLAVGGPIEGATGFQGIIDELRVYDVPVGPLTLARWAYGLAEGAAGPKRTDASFDFRKGQQGWASLGEAQVRVEDAALDVTLRGPDALVLVRNLAVDAEASPLCNVRLSASAGERGVLLLLTDRAVKKLPFRLIAGGAARTYTVDCAATVPHEGKIEAIGLSVDGAERTVLRLEKLSLSANAEAPPDLRILSLSPQRRIGGLNTPMPVTCWVRNAGRAAQVRLRLSASPAVTVGGQATKRVTLGFEEQVEVTWSVSSSKPVAGSVRVQASLGDRLVCSMTRPVSFARDPQAEGLALFRARPWLVAGYPRGMDFRHLWPNSVGFLEHNTAFLVDFGGTKITAALDLKRRYPDRLVLMQVNDETNGIWGSWHVVPRQFAVKEGLQFDPVVFPMPAFRGYWLLGARSRLTADFPAGQDTCELRVADPGQFTAQVWGTQVLRDVLIYRQVDDRPDWTHSEYASVVKADVAQGTIIVERWPREDGAQWHDYRAQEAFVAPSVGSIYRTESTPTWIKTWIPNLTQFCPQDPATGLDATTWWARHFADLWHTRLAATEPHPDGLQFDGLAESPLSDCDNDGAVDGCEFAGVNHWRLGLNEFFRKLRTGDGFRGLGEALILSDASNVWGARCPDLLNGSENEEFPSFSGPDYLPSGMDLYGVWCADSAPPSCSYLQGRYNCDSYLEQDWAAARASGKFHSDSLVRWSIAAACMGEGIYTFRSGAKRDRVQIATGSELLEYPWDEYHAGREGRYNWLGAPLGEAVRLIRHLGPDLLPGAEAGEGWTLTGAGAGWGKQDGPAGLSGQPRGVGVTVKEPAATGGPPLRGPKAAARVMLLGAPLSGTLHPDREYTVAFEVHRRPLPAASPGKNRPHEPWGWVGVCLQTGERSGRLQSILVGEKPRRVTLTLRPSAEGPARIAFHVGAQPGSVYVSDLSLREGCAEVFARRFENGLALANGSAISPYTFDTARLGGGLAYRRFLGSQAPEVNNGLPVGESLTLPPRDGILLMRDRD